MTQGRTEHIAFDASSCARGGYFFAVPGVRDAGDWYASGVFT